MAEEKTYYKGSIVNFSSSNGYPTYWNGKKNVLVHRDVWESHNGKIPVGYQIHHKDKNRHNYSIDNLEIIKSDEHQRHHAIEHGLGKSNKGKLKTHNSGFCKGATQVTLIKENESKVFESVTSASRFLGVQINSVSRVLRGKRKTIKGWRCVYGTQ